VIVVARLLPDQFGQTFFQTMTDAEKHTIHEGGRLKVPDESSQGLFTSILQEIILHNFALRTGFNFGCHLQGERFVPVFDQESADTAAYGDAHLHFQQIDRVIHKLRRHISGRGIVVEANVRTTVGRQGVVAAEDVIAAGQF
jgi:hypothetical protein